MNDGIEFSARAAIIGIGATITMDLWAVVLKRGFAVDSLDYALLGRWLAYLLRGQFFHNTIAASPPVRGELALGWVAHYTIGVGFSVLLLAIWGLEWAHAPTVGPALLVGVVTVVAPFLVMQPAFGLGIAAVKTSVPNIVRLKSLGAHTIYGVGLYGSARLVAWWFRAGPHG